MKTNIKILGLLLAAAGMSACQDDFDSPVVEEPHATLTPNMTIYELKQMFWDDAVNYIDTIGIDNGIDDGKEYVIAGRVVSSDEAGNVFKSLVIQDETAALALSINSYNLYLNYRIGQEIVLDLKGMYIGKYNGLVQLGMPEWYESGKVWEASFMAPEFFRKHAQSNGFPDPAKVDTIQVNAFSDLPTSPEGLCKWQSQLVKFNNVSFQNGGQAQFSSYHSSGQNENIVDVYGNTLPVRTSGYSNFWNKTLPTGSGDVVCILSYYGTTGWQLILNDYAGCMNFGNPTVAPGTEDKPYDVDAAIQSINDGATRSGWVQGYIVGAVAPEVTEVKSNDDIEWTADVVLNNTLVIGQTPDTKDIANALVLPLPQGSVLRKYGNLADNPANYKKQIKVKGTFGEYMSTYGVLNNTGGASNFWIEGVEIGGDEPAQGSESSPYTVANVRAGATGTDVWVSCYIVGWIDGQVYASGAQFNDAATVKTNLLVADSPDVTNVDLCIPVQLPSGEVRNALNLQDHPGYYKKQVTLKGNLETYFGQPGLKGVTQYKIDNQGGGDNPDNPPVSGEGSGEGTVESPYNVVRAIEVATANGSASDVSVYTEGYVISGSIDTSYGNGTWTICDAADGNGATIDVFRAKDFNNEKFTDANKVKVGDKIVVYAPLINYNGTKPETSYGYLYSINGETSGSGSGGGTDNPVNPPVVGTNSADFDTFNGGEPNTTSYGTYTTATGWVGNWILVGAGGTEATDFISTDSKVLFPIIDGTPARPGTLTSPTLAGGISTLTFNYGFPYNEAKVGFTVNIKQNGAVVASDTVVVDPATKAKVYTYTHDFSITGDFVIEIVNDCLTQSTSNNKDRLAVWNLTWNN